MINEILKKKEAELKNHKPVNTPTDKTLTDETFTDVTTADNNETTPDTTTIKEKKILKELVDKREANVKHFLMDDMSEEADVYPVPVHYKVKDQWQEIDNSMVSTEDNSFSNKANDFKITIAKDSTSNNLVNIKKDKYEVSWNVENVKKSNAQVINDNNKEPLSKEEEIKYAKNLVSDINFPDVFQDVDLNYNINSNNLKENIILKNVTDVNTITFGLSTKNVIPKLTKNNSVIFYDKKNKSEVFMFKAPLMYDANGNTSQKITMELTQAGDNYNLTMTPSKEWLNDNERVYPITIDPSITVSLPSEISNAIVKGGSTVADTTFNASSSTIPDLEVGNGTGTDGAEMSYLKFNLPKLSSADMITSAKLTLYDHSTTTAQINLYGVTESWTPNSNVHRLSNRQQLDF